MGIFTPTWQPTDPVAAAVAQSRLLQPG